MKIKILLLGVMMAAIPLLTGCSWLAKEPLDVLYYAADEDAPQSNLFIFMRGIGGSHRTFEEEGLVEDVRTMGLPFDMAAPNAHFAYYSERTLIVRLKADVIDPARDQGKDNVWLVGFSMGGLGSVLYLREQPQDIDGICLVAPYLGDDDIIEEIQAAGGVRSWSPGTYDPVEDWQRMMWHWIKDNVAGEDPVPIYLGYGTEDDHAPANALLAELLPEEQVVRIEGGHDYPTFKALWDRFLASEIYFPKGS